MLTDFTIKNFRGIKELTLPSLKRVNLFVGKNGVGKTSVLEAVSLHESRFDSAVAWHCLNSRFEDTLASDNEDLFKSLFGDSTKPLVLGPKEQLSEVAVSIGQDSGNVRLRRTWSGGQGIDVGIPRLGPVPRTVGKIPRPQVFVPSSALDNAFVAEYWTQIEFTGADELALHALKTVVPSVDRISVRGGIRPTVVAKVSGISGPVPLARLGEGATRITSLAIAIAAVQGGALLVDEFENGLHYSIQADVWRFLLRTAVKFNVQVFATTHSRDTVYALAEASKENDHIVYRLSRDGDEIEAKPFDHEYLEFAVHEALEIR